MIDGEIGIPVGDSLIFYNKEIKSKIISSDHLKEFIEKTKKDLDEASNGIDNKISMVGFYLTFLDVKNKKDLEFMSSTTDLTAFDSVEKGIRFIKKYYENGFKHFLEEIKKENKEYCLDIYIDFIGFRDKITQKIKMKDPLNP